MVHNDERRLYERLGAILRARGKDPSGADAPECHSKGAVWQAPLDWSNFLAGPPSAFEKKIYNGKIADELAHTLCRGIHGRLVGKGLSFESHFAGVIVLLV